MEENSLHKNFRRDITFTAANYSQMYKRLTANDMASRFFTTYYSAFSIILSLLPLFFEERIASRQMLEFLLLISSIIVLIVSLMISFAKYSERSHQVMVGLNQIKRLKKELVKYTDNDLTADDFKKYEIFVERYHQIVDHIELRADRDYYRACKELTSKEDCKENWHALPCSSKAIACLGPIAKAAFFLALFMLPIILTIVPGVIFK